MHKSIAIGLVSVLLAVSNFRSAEAAGYDVYKGTVLRSETRKIGETFTFANLNSSSPLVIYPSNTSNELAKVFENEELIVLVNVSRLTGSSEIYYLSKKVHRFTLVEVTTINAIINPEKFSDGEVRPSITYGKLN